MRKIQNWLEGYAEYLSKSEFPDEFIQWSGLFLISTALGRKVWMDFKYYKIYPSLFVVLVGPPGTFKSTMCDFVTKIILDIPDIHLGPDMSSAEALIKGFKSCEEEFDYNGMEHTHQSMAVVVPEWTTLIGEQNLHMCNILCRMSDCADRFDKRLVTRENDLPTNYFVTQFAGSTPEQIIKCLPASAIGSGLSSRIIFVVADEKLDNCDIIVKFPQGHEALLDKLKYDLEGIHNDFVGEFHIDKDAETWLSTWYRQHKLNREDRIIKDKNFMYYYNRKPSFIRSISMMLSAAERDDMIVTEQHFKTALDMLERAEYRMPESIGGFGSNPASVVVAAVKKTFHDMHKDKLYLKQIGARIWADMQSKLFKEALFILTEYEGAELGNDEKGKFLVLKERCSNAEKT